VSIIFLELRIDAGPILAQTIRTVPPGVGAGELEETLSRDGAKLLLSVIDDIKWGRHDPRQQDETRASINPLLTKKDGYLDFSRPAKDLACLVNGVDPWPGAQAGLDGKSLKLFRAESLPAEPGWDPALEPDREPGQVLGLDEEGRLMLATGQGLLLVREVQPEGKRRISSLDFVNGYRPERLSSLVPE
jgi:methionyl-tRNA formyltransferase